MKCSYCDFKLPKKAKYCPGCGKVINQEACIKKRNNGVFGKIGLIVAIGLFASLFTFAGIALFNAYSTFSNVIEEVSKKNYNDVVKSMEKLFPEDTKTYSAILKEYKNENVDWSNVLDILLTTEFDVTPDDFRRMIETNIIKETTTTTTTTVKSKSKGDKIVDE